MSPRLDIAWSTDSGTCEIARVYRGPAVFDAPTTEITVPYTKPPVATRRRYTIPAHVRAAAAIAVAALGAGICFVADLAGAL